MRMGMIQISASTMVSSSNANGKGNVGTKAANVVLCTDVVVIAPPQPDDSSQPFTPDCIRIYGYDLS